MFNKDRALEIPEGLIINQDDSGDLIEGPFITGGPSSPIGNDLPVSTFYIQNSAQGTLIWKKFGTGVSDWRQLSAQDLLFDDSNSNQLTASNIQTALQSLANRHYGKDFARSLKEANETTTGNSFDIYSSLTFDVGSDAAVNEYRINADFYWGHNSASNDIRVIIELDGVQLGEQIRIEPKDQGTDQRIQNNLLRYAQNLSVGSHTIDLSYRPASSSRQSRMYASTIEVWRVS